MSKKSGPRRSRWHSVLIVLVALALCYAGFELGRTRAGYSIVTAMREGIDLRRRNRELDQENQALQHRVATAEVGQRVDRQAQSEAQLMIGELQAETARQQQELTFYRGLVARQFGAGTLRVQELQVRAEAERRYRVLITLVQAASRESMANGTVTFTVEGLARGESKQLALAEVEPDRRRELPFSLRYFQQIEVSVELPPDFQPVSLQVEYRVGRDAEPARQTFPWRVEGESEIPVP